MDPLDPILPLLPTRRLCLLLLEEEWWLLLLCDLRERTNSFHAALFSVGDLAERKLVMAACCLELSGLLLLVVVVLLGGGVRCNEGEWGVLRGVDNSETCVSKEGESVIVLGILGSLTTIACCCLGEGMSGGVDGRIGVVDENVALLCGGDRLSNGSALAAAVVEEFSVVVASFILVSLNLKEMLGDGGVDGKL